MKSKNLVHLIIVLISIVSNAQIKLSGTVVDEKQQPIQGVSIYFDGTTIETKTTKNGTFSLNVQEIPNSKLIIRHLGYESFSPVDYSKPIYIQLKPKKIEKKSQNMMLVHFQKKHF